MVEPSRELPLIATALDFLDWVEVQPEHWQLIDGALVMMAGGTAPHAAIAANAIMRLGERLRGRGCRPYGSDFAVKIDDRNVFFPDVTVVCQPQRGRFADAPVLIVEVMSPSSEKDDRGRKWKAYQQLGSLQHYLAIDQERMEVELWSRDAEGWRYTMLADPAAEIRLAGLGIDLPLAALYEDVALADEAGEAAGD
jgi:Uma2 family endonuclease